MHLFSVSLAFSGEQLPGPVSCTSDYGDPWRRGCGHLRQRPNGSSISRGEGAKLRGTRHGLCCLFGAIHELPPSLSSTPSQAFINWVCEHTSGPPVWHACPPLVVQMTPKHTHLYSYFVCSSTNYALNTHTAYVCRLANQNARRNTFGTVFVNRKLFTSTTLYLHTHTHTRTHTHTYYMY